MSHNPFAALGDADDVEFTPVQNKNRKGILLYSQLSFPQSGTGADKAIKKAIAPVSHGQAKSLNNHINMRVKEDTTEVRKEWGNRPNKDISDHRLHDRRSGTGRVSEPRKNGGGAGGIGNIKDELNQDKILAKVKEDAGEEETTPKEPVIPSLTLDEYYQKQGINIEEVNQPLNRGPVKKGEIKADWVTKEKMTVLKTREDNEIEDSKRKATVVTAPNHKVEAPAEAELLGFKSSLPESSRRNRDQPQQQAPQTNDKRGPKKGAKLAFSEDDFPSL